MADFGRLAPALTWRAFFILSFLGLKTFAALPATPVLPQLAQMAPPTPAEARKIVEQFQGAGIAGEYYLEFELRARPQRGDEKTMPGKMWGDRNDQGAITRVAIADASGRESRFLLQNGPRPAVWSFVNGRIGQLPIDAWFAPLVAGVDIAPFDLQMPFLYWPDFVFEKLERKMGRPTHVFFFRPPAEFAKQHAGISGVRVYLDTQYNAPVQTEVIGPGGRIVKTLSLGSLKKIDDQWMAKSIDASNEATGDKTKFYVTAAALGLEPSPAIFQPAALADEIRMPAPERIRRLDP